LQAVASAVRALLVNDAAASTNPLGITRTEMIDIAQTVAMLYASIEDGAQDLDAYMMMRRIADPTSTAMAVVVDEHKGAERTTRGSAAMHAMTAYPRRR
jgi:hypothetical protein